MTFLHAYLLGGLALISAPLLVHLVTREKPKHHRFPAFRFLVQKYHTNRKKLRFHHLLLLFLRMLVIAAICFALSRPRLFSDRLTFLGGTQSVEVVLLVDTSPSMEYERGGLTRLDDARRRALELLEELPESSRVAVVDSADPVGQFEPLDEAREKLKALKIRTADRPLSRALQRAYALFNEELLEGTTDPPPRYLYLFGDRTRASWDRDDVRGLKKPESVNVVFVDVGADKVTDLAIEQIVIEPTAVTPDGNVRVRAIVLATGEKADRTITCQIDNDPRLQEKLVQVEAGARQAIAFDFKAASPGAEAGLLPGPHQLVIQLKGNDRLPFNNVHYATFVVRPGRKVLTLMDDTSTPQPWPYALNALGFTSDVKAMRDAGTIKFKDYDLVCLHQVADPSSLWGELNTYVNDGGKLAIIPGGSVDPKAYNDEQAKRLMPGTIGDYVTEASGAGIPWDWNLQNKAPLMAPFLRWKREQSDLEFWKGGGEPRVFRYWQVKPFDNARVLVNYLDGKANPPALVEREINRGKVILFTTKLDLKPEKILQGVGARTWNTYWQNSFGLILVDKVCRYLVGDSVAPDWNYIAGQTIAIPLPREGGDQYTLKGPGQPPQGLPLVPPEAPPDGNADRFLPISRAEIPGNYVVNVVRNQRVEVLEAFSLNIKPEESLLVPRVPKEEIEEVLGEDTVLDIEHKESLRAAISNKPQPVELLPYLMLLLLVFLAVENIVANRSRDKTPTPEAAPASPVEAVAFSWRPLLLVLMWTLLGVGLGAIIAFTRGGASGGVMIGVFVTGLLGMSHGFLTLARFGTRDGAILGGLLGSIVGVLYGWLVLGVLMEWEGLMSVVLGMIIGAGLMAGDGFLLGLRGGSIPEVPHGSKP